MYRGRKLALWLALTPLTLSLHFPGSSFGQPAVTPRAAPAVYGPPAPTAEQTGREVRLAPTEAAPESAGRIEVLVEKSDNPVAAVPAPQSVGVGLDLAEVQQSRRLLRRERAQRLHKRLRFDATLDLSFDSNLLQGEDYQTIAGKSSRGAAGPQAGRLGGIRPFRTLDEDPARGPEVYQRTVLGDYQTAAPALTQAGLPLNLALAVAGQPLTWRGVELWLGYRFAQTFMLYAQSDIGGLLPDLDTYHRQEHAAAVELLARPRHWLAFSGRIEGFVNLSGLQNFTPFQGGLRVRASGVVTESARWRTLAIVAYQLRHSFDQENDGYLNGNQLQLRVAQELRLRWVRPQLSYRLTYDATGVLQVQSPLAVLYTPGSNPTATPVAATLGDFTYFAPLTHHGHQFSASATFFLPQGIEAFGALRYEYAGYPDPYYATYTGNAVGSIPVLAPFTLPGVQRTDHRVTVEVSAYKALPHRLAVELSYGFIGNFSSIANAVDNRSYTKHTVMASVAYCF